MSTKNLGQVSGIHIGKTPPANEKLIWFDDTPSQRIHKIYDPSLGKWVVLQKDTISAITYSELVNLAKKSGLSLGSWYQIKDKANALALAVTSTKVKYTDQLGNILIDDLGTNIQYHVTSSNLTIDEVQGVFDETNKKIVFKFDEFVPDMTADDYVLGKAKKKNVWKLAKFKLSSFLSKVTGNSITWNGGFFFNFREAVKELFDKDGGIVSKETYDSEIEEMRRDIRNVGKDNQNIVSNCDKAISDATKDEEIYKKKAGFVDVTGEPVDAQEGHTLQNIVNNFQRFINRFKYASGIRIDRNFSDKDKAEYVNNNDSVLTAIQKIQYWIRRPGKGMLSEDWKEDDYSKTIPNLEAGDTLDEAFAKVQGKLNQVGNISNGMVKSREYVSGSSSIPRTVLNTKEGSLTFNRDVSAIIKKYQAELSASRGLSVKNEQYKGVDITGDGIRVDSKTSLVFQLPAYERTLVDNQVWDHIVGLASMVVNGQGSSSVGGVLAPTIIAGISAVCDKGYLSDGYSYFDAYFARLKAGGIAFGLQVLANTDLYIDTDCTFVSCLNQESKNLFLPTNPEPGQFVIVNQVNSSNVAVNGNGNKILDNEDVDKINVGGSRRIAVFLWNDVIKQESGRRSGGWLFARWSR